MSTVSIIPTTELKGLELALGELQSAAVVLPELAARASAIVKVEDAGQYAEAGSILAEVRSVKKAGAFKINPFLDIVKRVGDFLRTERSQHELKCTQIEDPLEAKMKDYKRRELVAAQAEQDRINAERRAKADADAAWDRKAAEAQAEADRKQREKEIKKAEVDGAITKRAAEKLRKEAEAEEKRKKEEAAKAQAEAPPPPEVKVAPSVPKVAGVRLLTNYRFEVINPDNVKLPWLSPDHVRIGQKVRADKDPQKSMAEIGGIRVWTE